jgi:hypothetical protein
MNTPPLRLGHLRQFIAAVAEMNAIVRDVILPNPDTE